MNEWFYDKLLSKTVNSSLLLSKIAFNIQHCWIGVDDSILNVKMKIASTTSITEVKAANGNLFYFTVIFVLLQIH